MVWRTLLYVMQWWLFKEKVRVVSLLGHPREIRESRDYGEMFSDISDIHFSTYSKQWIKLGFWMLKTLFTCLLYSMSIHRINLTWVNFAYDVISSLKIWPHRDIIIKHSPEEFIKKYPNNIVIVDATELKIQVPSSLQKHSETYSTYKSHTTFKSLIGVDPNGGIMFVSQLFEGSISDKQIVLRSGFLETVKQKVQCGELKEGDAIMADKGFDIGDDLAKLKLKCNIPPFLKDKLGFEEGDEIKTQTIAQHRIHVEKAIGKVRRFRIFHSVIPVSICGSINQTWSVTCFLSNFLNPVLSKDEIS